MIKIIKTRDFLKKVIIKNSNNLKTNISNLLKFININKDNNYRY